MDLQQQPRLHSQGWQYLWLYGTQGFQKQGNEDVDVWFKQNTLTPTGKVTVTTTYWLPWQ